MPRSLIIPRWIIHNGKHCWRVTIPKALGGGRLYFSPKSYGDDLTKPINPKLAPKLAPKSHAEALSKAKELESQRFGGLTKFAALPSDIQTAVMHALEVLGEGKGRDILPAAEMWVKHSNRKNRTVAQAVAECVEAKKGANKRQRSTYALENALKRFAKGREDMDVREVQTSEIERWINASYQKVEGGEWFKPSPKTKRSRQIDIGTLFNFCARRGYIDDDRNPIRALEEIEQDQSEPKSLSIDDCKAVLRAAAREHNGQLLGIVALQLFGGLRPIETYRLYQHKMHTFGDIIPLQGKLTKTRDRRNVTVNPTLRAWLGYAEKHGGGLSKAWDAANRMTEIHKAVQPWVSDYMRHSFVSYHNQAHGWEETIRQAGHSLAMMLDAYMTLVTKSDAEAFWQLKPEIVLGEGKQKGPHACNHADQSPASSHSALEAG